MESEYINRKNKLIEYAKEQIDLYQSDLDMTTEEDMASFYQGQLEAYEDMMLQIQEIM